MPISEVSAEVATAALHTPFVTALRTTSQVETVLVRIVDSDGAVGRGEGPQTWRITGDNLAGVAACVNGPLREALLHRDPDDLNALLDSVDDAVVANFAAKAAVDVALHDLAAQRLGVSLTRLLGGAGASVATDVTLAAGESDAMADAARQRVAEGFTTLKIKVGVDPDGDLRRLQAVRKAAGPEVTLRLDANQGWNRKQAVRIIRGLEDSGMDVELVEQPTHARNLDDLAYVTSRVDTPILADESVHGPQDLTRVISSGAADAVNVKLAKCGGLRAGRTMLSTARQHGLDTAVGSMMEGRIGVAAAASLAAAQGTTLTADLDAAWWLQDGDDALSYDRGILTLQQEPGLSAITFPPQNGASRRADGDAWGS